MAMVLPVRVSVVKVVVMVLVPVRVPVVEVVVVVVLLALLVVVLVLVLALAHGIFFNFVLPFVFSEPEFTRPSFTPTTGYWSFNVVSISNIFFSFELNSLFPPYLSLSAPQ